MNIKITKEERAKRGKLVNFAAPIIKLATHNLDIINLNDTLDGNAIFLSNHSGVDGPINVSLYFPKAIIPWGAYEMNGNYKSRWNFSYHIIYRKKLLMSKTASFIKATLLASVNKPFYKSLKLISTYPDLRFCQTLRESIEHLKNGSNILIFPEYSMDGYKDILELYNTGFVLLAKKYYKATGIDIPIHTMYYNEKQSKLIIDKPRYVMEYFKEGKNKEEIADIFRVRTNELYHEYILPNIKQD